MKCRVTLPLVSAAVLLISALSTGSPVLLLPAVLLLLLVGLGYLSVKLAAGTLVVEARVDPQAVQRGQDAHLKISVKYRAPLPVAPLQMELPDAQSGEPVRVTIPREGSSGVMEQTIHTRHVGVIRSGVGDCVIQDLFGMFSVTLQPRVRMNELLVLPQTFQVEELNYAPGESNMETLARATEDISNPSDLRSYAPGDPMKKIHWKQSLRKQELLVRRFEEPAMPQALVLMDCSPIQCEDEEQAADLRDALLETAASLLSMPHEGHTIRLPLLGEHPVQLHSSMGLKLLLEDLARADFSQTDRFERVLLLEGRRMGQVGSLVIITARLNGAVVQAITSLNRMCPAVRVYLITEDPKSERNLKYVSRLHHAAIQVSYVMPLKA